MASTPSRQPHASRFPESRPPFSLDPSTIGLDTEPQTDPAEAARQKPDSTRFRLDHADWIPKPHSAAIQQLGQMLWNAKQEQESSRRDIGAAAPVPDPSPRDQPWVEASPSRDAVNSSGPGRSAAPLKPAWEVDQLHWPSHSDRLMTQQQAVFTRMLAAFEDRQTDLKVIAVTGLRSDDDHSTLAISLARFIAARGEQVTLIDADPMDHSLAIHCGVSLESGWRDFQGEELGEALVRETTSNLVFVPQGIRHPLETSLEAPALSHLIERLRLDQDWIVVDAGMISGMLAMEPTRLPLFDAAVIIRHASNLSTEHLEPARKKLADIGIRFLAFADNLGQRRAAG